MLECDKCRAAAYVVLTKGALEIHLCAHHYREHHDKLREQGFGVIVDKRDELAVKP
jgi:hypothetical protein